MRLITHAFAFRGRATTIRPLAAVLSRTRETLVLWLLHPLQQAAKCGVFNIVVSRIKKPNDRFHSRPLGVCEPQAADLIRHRRRHRPNISRLIVRPSRIHARPLKRIFDGGNFFLPCRRCIVCHVFSQKNLTLTDAEREAVERAAEWLVALAATRNEIQAAGYLVGDAATLRGLLERMG